MKLKIIYITGCMTLLIGTITGVNWRHTQQQSQAFLVIREWGVRLQLPRELYGDVGYWLSPYGEKPVVLYSRSLAREQPDCAPAADPLNLWLVRTTATDNVTQYTLGGYRLGLLKRIGSHTYAVRMNPTDPSNWCFREHPTTTDPIWRRAKHLGDKLYRSLPSLESANAK
jgi:hypothetical protein